MGDLPKLPPIRNRINIDERWIDGTPAGFPLRILKAYRRRCDEKFMLEGDWDEGSRKLYDLMNEHQDARAKELDRAIRILEEASMPAPEIDSNMDIEGP